MPWQTWAVVLIVGPAIHWVVQRRDVPSRIEGAPGMRASSLPSCRSRDAAELTGCGGKAANLARLMAVGAPVPDGIVIPNEVLVAGATRVRGADAASLVRPVIVRSSAIGEDSADASFAGQLDSVADVTTETCSAQRSNECGRRSESDRGARVSEGARQGTRRAWGSSSSGRWRRCCRVSSSRCRRPTRGRCSSSTAEGWERRSCRAR